MVQTCVVPSCNARWKKGCGIRFITIPSDEPRRTYWLTAIGRRYHQPGDQSRICSSHFKDTDFEEHGAKKIKKDAVPSIFKRKIEEHNDEGNKKPALDHDYCKQKTQSPTVMRENTVITFDISAENMVDPSDDAADSELPTLPVYVSKIVSSEMSQCTECPKKQKHIKKLCNAVDKIRKENQRLKQKVNRLTIQNKISNAKNIQLTASVKNQAVNQIPQEVKFLVDNIAQNSKRKPQGMRYSNETREFALTFHHLSPRAYREFRHLLSLPSEAIIRNWCSVMKCDPGFFYPVLAALKDKVSLGGELCGNEDITLLMDGMHIKKGVVWDPGAKASIGTVDFGGIIKNPSEPVLATEAIIMQVVGLRTGWKIPIGYILTNGSPEGKVLKTVLEVAITKLTDCGLNVVCITMDGATSNVEAFNELGAEVRNDVGKLKVTISHPLDSCKQINIMLDPPHMMKLGRNALHKYKCFRSALGIIQWQHLGDLHNLQEKEGLRLSPKLSSKHIHYSNLQMKVYIAGQTLSRHNADALEYLKKGHFILPPGYDFSDTGATIEFLRNMNDLFDITNSHCHHKEKSFFKRPITPYNMGDKIKHLNRLIDYLTSLKTLNGRPLYKSRRKTFVIGFISAARSIINISKILFQSPLNIVPHYKYFSTYRLQQDPLEHLIGNVRGCGGWNNNPDAVNIKYRMRKMVLPNHIMPSVHANCKIYPDTAHSSLFKIGTKKKKDVFEEDIPDVLLDLSNHMDSQLSEFIKEVIYYMAGWLVRVISPHIRCALCLKALIHQNYQSDHSYSKPIVDDTKAEWIAFKNNGGLVYASDGVFKVMLTSEKVFRVAQNLMSMNKSMIVYHVNQELSGLNLFPELKNHVYESGPHEDIHCTQLIKTIAGKYIETRIKTWCKKVNTNLKTVNGNVREKNGRRILYSNV